MTTVVISQPMLFPWVGMFEQIALADVYVHYDDVQFSKGSFTNRVQLKTAEGSSWLTIPLDKSQQKPLIKDLQAADIDWRSKHRDQFRASYRLAPHFGEAGTILDETYRDPEIGLADLLMGSLELMAERLCVTENTTFVRSSELAIGGSGWPRVLDVVRQFEGDTYVTGHGAGNYLDSEAFQNAGVEVRYMDYAMTEYPQLHGTFTPYVSVLDLIANMGPEAPNLIAPRTVGWRDFPAQG